MDEITKYRKVSAKKIGLTTPKYAKHFYWKNNDWSCAISDWKPDERVDQREMIEEWLIKQHTEITIWHESNNQGWSVELRHRYKNIHSIGSDKSKSVAFRLAFMEYINQLKKRH